jgi:urea transport system permease protein
MRAFHLFAVIVLALFVSATSARSQSTGAEVFAKAVLAGVPDRPPILQEFATVASHEDAALIELWRRGEIWVATLPDGSKVPVLYNGQTGSGTVSAKRVDNGTAVSFELSQASASNPDRSSRRLLTGIGNVLALRHPSDRQKADAARQIGLQGDVEGLKVLQELLPAQESEAAKKGFQEGIALAQLKLAQGEEKTKAVKALGELGSLVAKDQLTALLQGESGKPEAARNAELVATLTTALGQIESKQGWIDAGATLFRGLSLGSVLLVVAIGLAITFGLMGVINMAHGEFITIGGYTCFMVQTWFISQYGSSGTGFDSYFLVSLPVCFLAAALMGLIVEWSIVRHLYSRPLESLLATWGLSMILQQAFRLHFGAANVQVSSPSWLAGNFELLGITLAWNRLFVIGFALFILVGTLLVMAKTPVGLQLRAVMQNRRMAASLGIRTARMNAFTFAFGSGLAGLAGAFLSQLGNVGPSMGQSYIVDCFMIVTVGGVGNIVGAALSSLGIGSVDQMLQPLLGPVMGKITTLLAVILLLQWRPGGLFPSRSRSLEG